MRPAIPADVAGKFSDLGAAAGGRHAEAAQRDGMAGGARAERLRQSGQLPDRVLIDAHRRRQDAGTGPWTKRRCLSSCRPAPPFARARSPMRKPPTSNLDGDNYLGVGPDGQEARFVSAGPTHPAASSTSTPPKPFTGRIPAPRGHQRRHVARGRQGWHGADGDRQWRRPDEQPYRPICSGRRPKRAGP